MNPALLLFLPPTVPPHPATARAPWTGDVAWNQNWAFDLCPLTPAAHQLFWPSELDFSSCPQKIGLFFWISLLSLSFPLVRYVLYVTCWGGVFPYLRVNVPWGPSHAQLSPPLSSLSTAKSKPIIAEPEIHGAQPLDGVTGFLVLMSEGLYKALEAAHGPGQANQVSWAWEQRRPSACGVVAPLGTQPGL